MKAQKMSTNRKEQNKELSMPKNKYSVLDIDDADDINNDQNIKEVKTSPQKDNDDFTFVRSKEKNKNTHKNEYKNEYRGKPFISMAERPKLFQKKEFKNDDNEDVKTSEDSGWEVNKKGKGAKGKQMNSSEQMTEKKILEDNDDTYNSNEDLDDIYGNNCFLGSQWSVWVHKSDCADWTESSYENIEIIKSIGSFWKFFNNFHLLDKTTNQLFVMRDQIKPIWEDNENRKGGICSIKLDCFSRYGKMDLGSEVMICLCILMMNETLIPSNQEINGISYSVKNKSVLIKIWYKDFRSNIADKLPLSFFNKLDMLMRNTFKAPYGNRKLENLISIQCKPIKPEYDIVDE